MYQISMNLLCLGRYSEVFLDEAEHTELIVEDLVSLILLDLCGVVIIDEVKVTCTPITSHWQAQCLIQLSATCHTENAAEPASSLTTLEAKFENAISCALLELFDVVLVNELAILAPVEAAECSLSLIS